MKNFREEQINSTNEYCINQYWEKDVDEEIEGKEIVTGYEVKRARFKRFTIKAT